MAQQDDPDSDRIEAPLERTARVLTEPFQDFAHAQTASGWVLIGATFLAIACANSPLSGAYLDLIHAELNVDFAGRSFGLSLKHWVNDGLMAFFFFLLGLELKRELIVGQLREPQRALSVMCGAAGGMLLPATFFLLAADSPETADGWGIPVATDTAFALVVLVLLGDRVPVAARAFLVGLAIVDDLGAILIIAFAYTASLDTTVLLPTVACAAILVALNLTGVRNGWFYFLAGIALWVVFLKLGLHGTLAGVAVALVAPVRPAIPRRRFLRLARDDLRRFEAKHDEETESILEQASQQDIAHDVLRVTKAATAPLRRWEANLDRPIGFFVMPVFAFMNAGVVLTADSLAGQSAGNLGLAIVLGLLLGKPAGILGGVLAGRALRIAELPAGLGWRHVLGIGLVGGIGFTMSLFIASLSFGEESTALETAKLGIIGTSICAAVLGYSWLRWCAGPGD